VKLAKQDGEPRDLAIEALKACRAEEADLAKLVPFEEVRMAQSGAIYYAQRAIRDARMRPESRACAACGMTPTQDPVGVPRRGVGAEGGALRGGRP
jgi:hypothetical protein